MTVSKKLMFIITIFIIILSNTEPLLADWVEIDHPYYYIDTWGHAWGPEPGLADYRAYGNEEGGGVSALSGAWYGVAAGQATIDNNIFISGTQPVAVKAEFTITTIDGCINYGFGSFSGTRIAYGVNHEGNISWHYKDLEYGLSFSNVLDKIIALAGLCGYAGVPAGLTEVQQAMDVVGFFGDIYDYAQLASSLSDLVTEEDAESHTISFTFWAYPGWNTLKIGVRTDAAGLLTGSAFSMCVGQVSDIKYYADPLEGEWVPIPAENSWIVHEVYDPDNTTWWDKALKDHASGFHIGDYHPFSVTHSENYVYRHDINTYSPDEYLILNNGLGSPVYNDEYIELNYNSTELTALVSEGTFEAWVKPMANNPFYGHVIYTSEGGSANGWGDDKEIHLSCYADSTFSFYIGENNTNKIELYSGDIKYQPNNQQYYHIAGTYFNRSGNLTAYLYVDGEQVDWDTHSSTASITLGHIALGKCFSNDTPRYFKGKMKGIEVHGRMLTQEEIQLSYWQGGGDTGNPTTPVVAGEPEYSPATANLISWEASTDDISGVAYYNVKCVDNSKALFAQDSTESKSHIFMDLQHGMEYTYYVAAIDSAGNSSSWSASVTSIQDTLQPTQPVMNSEPSYTLGTSNTVFWTASTDETSDVGYWIQCATDTTFSDTLDLVSEAGWILETNYVFTGLQIGNTYYYRVKARDEAGNESDTSNVVSSIQDDGSTIICTTYYVSPSGDDGTGDGSLDFPWRNIQTAVDSASSGDIIKVMDDNDSTTVDYEEYNGSDPNGHIVIYKRITIERYDDDNTRPQVKALFPDYNIFYINSDSVTIKGLDIYGATTSNTGGIRLSEASDCTIENNRCGWDADHKNYYGIFVKYYSHNNIIRNNICSSNTNTGIYLYGYGNDNNIISGNICNSNNSNGICLRSQCQKNFIHDNTCNSSPTSTNGICLYVSGKYNTISGNNSTSKLHLTSTGRTNISGNNFCSISGHGYLPFLTVAGNTFSGEDYSSLDLHNEDDYMGVNTRFYFNNVLGSIYTTPTYNIWKSLTKIGYIYGGSDQTYKNYMGNFYSAYAGSDIDNDGIGDESFVYDGITDNYPLMMSTDNYSLQAWWLANSIMYRGDLSKQGGIVGINTGSSHIWVSDQMTLQDIEFQAGNQSEETSWTGHITFTTTPSSVDSIIIEIGYADNQNGNGFSAQGPQARLSGLDFEDNMHTVTFTTTAQSFTIPQGKYLAMKLTNYGGYYYSVRVGGSWSFIQAPLGSQDFTLPVELSSFTAVYTNNESGNDFVTVKWETASETDVNGFNIYRSEYDDIGTVGNHINSYLIPGHGSTSDPHIYLFEDIAADVHIPYNYWLEVVDYGGIQEYYGPIKYVPGDIDGDQIVDVYDATILFSNYPNPAKNLTTIKYQLKGSVVEQDASIRIYNILGELVKIVKGNKGKAELDVSDLATGIYLYQLKTSRYNEVKKLIIVR